MANDRLLTPTQVAERINTDVSTVQRWFREGRIAGALITPGNQYRVPIEVADQLLQLVPPTGFESRAAKTSKRTD